MLKPCSMGSDMGKERSRSAGAHQPSATQCVSVIPMLNPSFGPLLFNYMLSGLLLSRLPSPYQRDMPSV